MKHDYLGDNLDDYEYGFAASGSRAELTFGDDVDNSGELPCFLTEVPVEVFDIHDDFVEPRCDSFFERYADAVLYAEVTDRAFSAARSADDRRVNHARVAADRARARAARKAAYVPVTHGERNCEHCGTSYVPARRDARFCGTRCRVAANRAAKRG